MASRVAPDDSISIRCNYSKILAPSLKIQISTKWIQQAHQFTLLWCFMMHARSMHEHLGVSGKVSLACTDCRKLAFTHGWQMASSKQHSCTVSNSYTKWITANGSQSVWGLKTTESKDEWAAVGRTRLRLHRTSLVNLPSVSIPKLSRSHTTTRRQGVQELYETGGLEVLRYPVFFSNIDKSNRETLCHC